MQQEFEFEEKTELIQVRVPISFKRELKAFCSKHGWTNSVILRLLAEKLIYNWRTFPGDRPAVIETSAAADDVSQFLLSINSRKNGFKENAIFHNRF